MGLPVLIQLVFFVFLLIFTVFSSLMIYHWFAYGISARASKVALVIYLSVSLVCLLIMALAAFIFI